MNSSDGLTASVIKNISAKDKTNDSFIKINTSRILFIECASYNMKSAAATLYSVTDNITPGAEIINLEVDHINSVTEAMTKDTCPMTSENSLLHSGLRIN